MKSKVLDNVEDLFNDLYYIYKDKCNEEKDGLNAKNKKLLYYKKLRLDNYQFESEEEKQQTSKKPDKKDEESKLDKKTENVFKEIKNQEKIVDKKRFLKYFSYEPTALVNKLLGQNTQDLRKSLNEIKQQKIKLKEDERNRTNNKNKNDDLNDILSVINKIYQFFEYKVPGEQPDESKWPNCKKVSKQRFDVIQSKVQNAKNNNLQARPKGGKIINFNESNELLNEIKNSQITYEEALKIIRNIRRAINKLVSAQGINPNQINVLNILFMVNEIFTPESESIEINEKGDLEISNKEKQPDNNQQTTIW